MDENAEVEIWRGQMRLPMGVAQWVKDQARENFRSMNAEFLAILRSAMNKESSMH